MGMAEIPSEIIRRVRQLFQRVAPRIPELATTEQLPLFLLLARQPWVRSPDSWVPPSGSWRRRRASLGQHLLGRFPIPAFLLSALEVEPCWVARVPVEDEWAFELMALIGRGCSLTEAVSTGLLPPLTRRMCHLLLSAHADRDPVCALREAQVMGFGANRSLAEALMRTPLSQLQGPDHQVGEAWWHGAIGWLSTREGLTLTEVPELVAWIGHARREAVDQGKAFELTGRPLAAVRRHAVGHQQRLRVLQASVDLPPSGLFPFAFKEGAIQWSVAEILSSAGLAEEGTAMSNCVQQYRKHVQKCKTAIFSLRADGQRRATIEVARAVRRVVQAKGPANRRLTPEERRPIEAWALRNRLAVAF